MIDTIKQAYLEHMGIDVWRERVAQKDMDAVAEQLPVAVMDWRQLATCVRECRLCDLAATRTQTVFGVGNQAADLVLVGEAPGAEEDRQGEPFVGRAGQLLNAMLHAIGLQREQIYIMNILKCRPPNNRDPQPSEITQCSAYLERQLALLQPKVVVALGRVAAHHLLKNPMPLAKLRGKVWQLENKPQIPLIVTYHPAYLLRSPHEKVKSYLDLLQLKRILAKQ